MNIDLMKYWILDFCTYIGSGSSVLILDRLAVHTNRSIIAQLEAEGVKVFLIPSQGGKFVSPFDNFFFAHLKCKMVGRDCTTTELKESAFYDLCFHWSADGVVNSWVHCSWVYPGEA
jgi:hypothetical protein